MFGSDLFFARPLETSLVFEIAGEMSFSARVKTRAEGPIQLFMSVWNGRRASAVVCDVSFWSS
jgi:hypothetical protein